MAGSGGHRFEVAPGGAGADREGHHAAVVARRSAADGAAGLYEEVAGARGRPAPPRVRTVAAVVARVGRRRPDIAMARITGVAPGADEVIRKVRPARGVEAETPGRPLDLGAVGPGPARREIEVRGDAVTHQVVGVVAEEEETGAGGRRKAPGPSPSAAPGAVPGVTERGDSVPGELLLGGRVAGARKAQGVGGAAGCGASPGMVARREGGLVLAAIEAAGLKGRVTARERAAEGVTREAYAEMGRTGRVAGEAL